MLHLFGQVQHEFRSTRVQQDGLLQRLVESNGGRTMVDNRYLVDDSLPIRWRHAQVQLRTVPAHYRALAEQERQPVTFLQSIE